ncbi:MAG: DUF2156 domain-containing protein [Bacteroides sp.]|nr:DUF2156 domain-containing protein [Bacteroides sp.]
MPNTITTLVTPILRFAPFTTGDIPEILPMLAKSPSRTCDFTVGGIYLWKDYFLYSREIINNTLFIKGVAEDDLTQSAFSLPMGEMPLADSLHILKAYCEANNVAPLLSAVPEDRIEEIRSAVAVDRISELPDWADYLYDIEPMSTFQGKKMSKKRNHVNRFHADHPDAVLEPLTEANIPEALEFLSRHSVPSPEKSITADYDLIQTADTLRHFNEYNYEGAFLRVPGIGPVAFTAGEVIGDTLYVHIEKMDHDVNGSGETISSGFCRMMRERYPELRFVNREDSSGDPGLARAKEAYRPIALLKKYNVLLG